MRLADVAEDIEAHGDGAAIVRGFDADELAARIGVIRVGAVEGNPATSGLAMGDQWLEQVVAGYRAADGHDARCDGCQDGEGDRRVQAGLVEGLALAFFLLLPTLAVATDIRAYVPGQRRAMNLAAAGRSAPQLDIRARYGHSAQSG